MKTLIIALLLSISIQYITLSHSFAFTESTHDESNKKVAVIINSELYPQVKESIDRYLEDLKNEGYKVIFSEWDDNAHPGVEELKALLKNYYHSQNIQGAVLIGALPFAEGLSGSENGPIDTYLMDFDSEHFIKRDGVIVDVTAPLHLDIWVSRIWANMRPYFCGEFHSEATLINMYFEKNHIYRTCGSPVPDLKIKFAASKDDCCGTEKKSIFEYYNSWVNWYEYASKSGYSEEYLKFTKDNPAQYLFLCSHSDPKSHIFNFSNSTDDLSSNRLEEQGEIKQPFVLLNACSACNFKQLSSLGNVYLFSPNSSVLVIAGSSIPNNIGDIEFLYSNGDSFGENFIGLYAISPTAIDEYFWNQIWATWMINSNPNPYSLAIQLALGLGGSEFVKYLLKDIGKAKNFGMSFIVGQALLGDPTLKAYVDMDWCPDYDPKQNL